LSAENKILLFKVFLFCPLDLAGVATPLTPPSYKVRGFIYDMVLGWKQSKEVEFLKKRKKAKFTLGQAMKAQRGSRGILYFFFNLGTRWGWVVDAVPHLRYLWERDLIPMVKEMVTFLSKLILKSSC
jgi:hypothetical protein